MTNPLRVDHDHDYVEVADVNALVPPGEVQVWVARVSALKEFANAASSILTEQERRKVSRFRFEADQLRSSVARGLLRLLVGRASGTPAQELALSFGQFGKPSVSDGPNFNLSHSDDYVVLAIGNTGELGIDVESPSRNIEPIELARTCFSSVEQTELAGLNDTDEIRSAFFRGWTRKESFIKALGYGLQAPLDQFDVSLEETSSDTLRAVRLPNANRQDWQVLDLQLTTDTRGAIAVRHGSTQRIVCRAISAPQAIALLNS